jgi:hypothetical protein
MRRKTSGLIFEESEKPFTRVRRAMAALGLAAAIVAAGYLLWIRSQSASADSLARIDRPLPPIVVDSAGHAVDLRTVGAGARRIIVFYSPSCRACREVLSALQPFPADLRLIMVNESSNSQDEEISGLPAADRFHDRGHALSRAFTTIALPTVLFVDGDGVLRDGLVGRHEQPFIQKRLKEFAIQSGSRALQQR